tara:strand:- start:1816 stop:2301 length:486 start_codon:yes stop_codon:yes gene_type:complete
MIKFKNTLKRLGSIGVILRKGLQDELKAQKHNATGRLSGGLKYHIKDNVLSIISSVSYWKAVNNPSFAKIPNLNAIQSWMNAKNLKGSAVSILRKLQNKGYGKPYSFWTEGNNLRRTDFAGYTANKFKKKVVKELSPAIGKDVADMIRSQMRKNNPKARVS